jgi:putative CocE/NonD family hydrolase
VVDFDVAVPMRDGVQLRANVYRPAQGRWPVLLTRLPYGKDLPLGTLYLDPAQAARQGYVVVVQDTRGRFASDGEWFPFRHEAEDGFDTIAWAAQVPFSNGQVGMYGASYLGFTQWSAATLQPPALKAIVPFITWCDPLNGLAYRGGALELGVLANWNVQMGLDMLVRRHRTDPRAVGSAIAQLVRDLDALGPSGYGSLPLREFEPLRHQDIAPFFFELLEVPMDSDYLDPLRIRQNHARVQVPSFNVGGWYDIFLADTLANFTAMRQQGLPAKLLIGPWSHNRYINPVGELNFGFGAQLSFINLQSDFGRLQLRWFDHWLKDIDTGIVAEPPVKIFVMGANVWRDEQDWPLSRARSTAFYLHADGQLGRSAPRTQEPDQYVYDPADPVPTIGGPLLMTPEFPAGPFDQRPIEQRPDVLTYTTPPLERDTEVTGPVVVRLWASSSATDTDFVARLVDVYPDGRAMNVTDGIVRARYRAGSQPSLIEPGRAYCFEIDLWSTSIVFRAGHCIRLQVTSSCFPRWDRNPNTGHTLGADAELQPARQTIFHDSERASHVVLPVVE